MVRRGGVGAGAWLWEFRMLGSGFVGFRVYRVYRVRGLRCGVWGWGVGFMACAILHFGGVLPLRRRAKPQKHCAQNWVAAKTPHSRCSAARKGIVI